MNPRKYGRRTSDGIRAYMELVKDALVIIAVISVLLGGGDLISLLKVL